MEMQDALNFMGEEETITTLIAPVKPTEPAIVCSRVESFNYTVLADIISRHKAVSEVIRGMRLESGNEENDTSYWSKIVDTFKNAKKHPEDPNRAESTIHYAYSAVASRYTACGRLFAKNGGLQHFPRVIRSLCAAQYNVDVDMVNCHPCVLAAVCKKAEIPCEILQKYIHNREGYLEQICSEIDVKREVAKQAFLSIMNGGGEAVSKRSEFLAKWRGEITRIVRSLAAKNLTTKYRKQCEAAAAESKKTWVAPCEYRMMNAMLCDLENGILQAIIKCVEEEFPELIIGTLQFDGLYFTVPHGVLYLDYMKKVKRALSYISEQIAERCGIPMRLEIKPMENLFDLYSLACDVPSEALIAEQSPLCKLLSAGQNVEGAREILRQTTSRIVLFTPDTKRNDSFLWLAPNNIWEEHPRRALRTQLSTYIMRSVACERPEFILNHTQEEIEWFDKASARLQQTASTWFDDIHSIAHMEFIHREPMGPAPCLFPFSNGYAVDTGIRAVRLLKPTDYCVRHCGYPYEECRVPPVISRVREIIYSIFESDEYYKFLMSVFCAMFHGENLSERCLFMLGESGSNGKGLLSDLLKLVAGDLGVVGISNMLFTAEASSGHDSKLANLAGKRLVIVDEGTRRSQYKADRFKQITNNGHITCSAKGKDEQTFPIEFVPIVLSNNTPNFGAEVDQAVCRRVVPVRFPFEFKEASEYDATDSTHRLRDDTLKSYIKSNSSAVRQALLKLSLEHLAQYGHRLQFATDQNSAAVDTFLNGETQFTAEDALREYFVVDDSAQTPLSVISEKIHSDLSTVMLGRLIKQVLKGARTTHTKRGNMWNVVCKPDEPTVHTTDDEFDSIG